MAAAVLGGSACSSMFQTSPALVTALAPAAGYATGVECDATTCKERWERAQIWVAKHSMFKIQTATDVLIQTFGTQNDVRYTFSVTKEPLGGGKYRIVAEVVCGSWNIHMCRPPEMPELRTAIHYFIATGEDVFAKPGAMEKVTSIR
jgi:hypothetical protein